MPEAAMTTQGPGAGGGATGQGAQPGSGGPPANAPGAAEQRGGGGGASAAAPIGAPPAGPAGGASTANIEQLRKEIDGLRKQNADKEAQIVASNTLVNKWMNVLGDDPDAVLQALQRRQQDAGAGVTPEAPAPAGPYVDVDFETPYRAIQESHGPVEARRVIMRDAVPYWESHGLPIPEWAAGIVALERARVAAARPAPAPFHQAPAAVQTAQPPAPTARTQVQELLLQRQIVDGIGALAQRYGTDWLLQKRVTVAAETLDIDGVTEPMQLTPAEAIALYFREHNVSIAQAARDLFGEQLEDRRAEVEVQRKLAGPDGLMPLGGGSVNPPPPAPPNAQRVAIAKALGLLSGGVFSLTPSETAAPIKVVPSTEEWGSNQGPVGML